MLFNHYTAERPPDAAWSLSGQTQVKNVLMALQPPTLEGKGGGAPGATQTNVAMPSAAGASALAVY